MKLKILLVVALSIFVFSIAATAFAMTDQEKQALIAQIEQQLVLLQQQLAQALASEQGNNYNTWCYTFNNNLGYTNSGSNDVFNLHLALQQQGIPYSPDTTNTYSSGTAQAVTKFQTKFGISPQSGYVGSLTRNQLNILYGCRTTMSTSPTTTACTPNWKCGNWGSCSNGQKTRYCYDSSNCKDTHSQQPITTQICTASNCNSNSDCGYSGFTGSPFCQTGNVYQIYTTWTCNNPGMLSSRCSSSTDAKLNTTCNTIQYCKNGSCTVCTPSWSCTGFSACVGGVQTQTCTDTNNCHNAANKPSEAQACGYNPFSNINCTPSWQCNNWSTCFNNQQIRFCSDSHFCGTTTNKPATTQSCN